MLHCYSALVCVCLCVAWTRICTLKNRCVYEQNSRRWPQPITSTEYLPVWKLSRLVCLCLANAIHNLVRTFKDQSIACLLLQNTSKKCSLLLNTSNKITAVTSVIPLLSQGNCIEISKTIYKILVRYRPSHYINQLWSSMNVMMIATRDPLPQLGHK